MGCKSSPSHYDGDGMQCADAIRAALGSDGFEAFCRGNVMKYLWRYDRKGGADDLRKARTYLDWLIDGQG